MMLGQKTRQYESSYRANADNGVNSSASGSIIDCARKYIAKMPLAISGRNGHSQTLTVACTLVKGFNLTVDEARPLLREYSQRCHPPWRDAELEHKLSEADKLADEKPRGYLILSDRTDRARGKAGSIRKIELPCEEVGYSECAQALFCVIAPSHTMFNRGGKVVEMVQDTLNVFAGIAFARTSEAANN